MSFFFFFNDTATTEIYTLSLHDALPISDGHHDRRGQLAAARKLDELVGLAGRAERGEGIGQGATKGFVDPVRDRKSTRLNSSHSQISYAVFCLKKKTDTQFTSDTDTLSP